MTQNQGYVEVGKVSEISNGQMKHIDIDGKEIVIANANGNLCF
jgi:nitrite reductase/ring-hydroxylating ferredoxin subunit